MLTLTSSTIELKTVSIGYLAAEFIKSANTQSYPLQVHSRFQHAMNLKRSDGYLLTLLSANHYANLADAIRLNLPASWDWREKAIDTEKVGMKNEALHGAGWSISGNGALCWQPDRTAAHAHESLESGAQHYYAILLHALTLFCAAHRISSELSLFPNAHSGKKQPELSLSVNATMLNQQIAQLIGFGRGLTPDGDDYLLGYIAALWRWRQTPKVAEHFTLLCRGIADQLFRTNDISAHYLKRAVQGHFSEPICELIQVLATKKNDVDVNSAALAVMQFGASSGADCLAGFLHGLRALKATQ